MRPTFWGINKALTMNKINSLSVAILFIQFSCFRSSEYDNNLILKEEPRRGKFLTWGWGIGFVRFANNVCMGLDGSEGTCYTKRQCMGIRGLNSGKCAQVGACCVVQRTCGATSAYNNTYFVNPNFPRTFTGGSSCVFTIQKCGSDICQARIDFLSFSLAQPDALGRCVSDALTITGSSTRLSPICGENSGQHVYLDFNGNEDIRLTIDTNTLTMTRSWKLKISQIACASENRAPFGCLMYYTDVSRTVQSFNYGTTESGQTNGQGQTGTRQLVNQNYGICIAAAPGYCSIDWQSSQANSFTLSGNTQTGTISITGALCTTDFIVIPNPFMGTTPLNYERFCGNSIPTITSSSKPFVLTVVNDNDEVADVANRGFSLTYTQRRCSSLTTP